ncbi:hypothetical protein N1851_030168 [Merluccius polli]|uniref:Uncharacterized protein n=1 Tax=Merluccius polli TaxID=89951 RepID=A0AA47M634_MERPO|nr:hypothetical protein N1851_030168 [Merluccius polli]
MFGRQPRVPIDLVLGIHPDMGNHKTPSMYVKGLCQRLQESYSLAAKSFQKMGEKNKARFDKKLNRKQERDSIAHCRDQLLPCGFQPSKEVEEHSSHTDTPRKMRLRDKTTKDTQGDADYQEDELYS